jgi:GT2 family glycosyltransferase
VQIVVVAGGYERAELEAVAALGGEIVVATPMPRVSAARNLGARSARGAFLVFLDDDNTVDIAFLRELVAEARSGGATMLGPAMYYGYAPDVLWCAGVARTPLLLRTVFTSRLPPDPPMRIPSEGLPNCFLVRRDEFEAVGGFDEQRFPQHFEESDLAERLRKRFGAPAFGVPRAIVWHHMPRGLSRSFHIKNEYMAYQCARARAVYTALHGTAVQWLVFSAFAQFAYAAVYLGVIVSGRRDIVRLAGGYVRGMVAGWTSGASLRCPR